MREPTKKEIVTPAPYFKVAFECGNRAFYEVKNDVVEALTKAGLEPFDDYFTEKCDYEGDLEEIIIYAGGREAASHKAIVDLYGLDILETTTIHLSIF